MFDKEFFPTPEPLIEKMLSEYYDKYSRYNRLDRIILEPSAGKGDILHFLFRNFNMNTSDLYCCEKYSDLAAILQSKEYNLIGTDFLELETDIPFNFIIMNPPFSNAHEHLMKAWDVLDKGDIICLMNANTVLAPSSKERALCLQHINKHGSFEIVKNGFSTAERKTDIDVAIVKLKKEESQRFHFFDNLEQEIEEKINIDSGDLENEVAVRDIVENIRLAGKVLKDCYLEQMKHQAIVNVKAKFFKTDEYSSGVFENVSGSQQERYSKLSRNINAKSWKMVFEQVEFSGAMTLSVLKDFNAWRSTYGNIAFTKENVNEFLKTLIMNQGMIMRKSLEDAWESMTSFHRDNKIHAEGWKTNDAYKVNKKVIMPYMISFDEKWYREYGAEFKLPWDGNINVLSDYDSVLKHLMSYNHIQWSKEALEQAFNRVGKIHVGDKYDNTAESSFFKFKFFKKGTLHMEFKDEEVWQRFNMEYAKGKNWLPEDYEEDKSKRKKKTSSNQMTIKL